jgi:hypothetical protein
MRQTDMASSEAFEKRQKSSDMLHVYVLVLIYPCYCRHSSDIKIGFCCRDTQHLSQVWPPDLDGRENISH